MTIGGGPSGRAVFQMAQQRITGCHQRRGAARGVESHVHLLPFRGVLPFRWVIENMGTG
jgi:hypothetical protein